MSWLFKKDNSSLAAFEKELSKLSSQISTATSSLDATRSRARRIKALWTLYTTLTYLLYTLIITLVLGPHKWTIPHYAGLLGAPLVIYGVREVVRLGFDWRMSRQQSHIDRIQQQREAKIAGLKEITKYDSTQELLQKYGDSPKQTPSKEPQQGRKRKINPPPQAQPQRTGIAPPPTANIPGRNYGTSPPSQQSSPMSGIQRQPFLSTATHSPVSPDEPGFAPNAFSVPAPSAYGQPHHWYDRLMDVLLGEDESSAKNRPVLICSKCRLVNGQAPPGVKTLEEIGKWRCSSCGAWNGLENEVVRVAKEMEEEKEAGKQWEKPSVEAAKESTDVDSARKESPTLETMEVPDSDDEGGSNGSESNAATEESTVSKRMTRSARKQLEAAE